MVESEALERVAAQLISLRMEPLRQELLLLVKVADALGVASQVELDGPDPAVN